MCGRGSPPLELLEVETRGWTGCGGPSAVTEAEITNCIAFVAFKDLNRTAACIKMRLSVCAGSIARKHA